MTAASNSWLTALPGRWLGLGICALVFWCFGLNSSLWLDEAVSAWIVDGGLSKLWQRTEIAQGPSTFYYYLIWALTYLFGDSEVVLRVPSILCAFLLVLGVYKLAKELFSSDVAYIAALLVIPSWVLCKQAGYARPYTLATLGVVFAFFFFIRWCRENRTNDYLLTLVFAGVAVFAHYLTVIVFPALLVCYFCERSWRTAWITDFVFLFIGLSVVVTPLLPTLLSLQASNSSLAFAQQPALLDLIGGWIHIDLLFPLLVAFLAVFLFPGDGKATGMRRIPVWLIVWLLSPALLLFLYSKITGSSIFVSRYLLWSVPAFSIMSARLVVAICDDRRMVTFVGVFLFISISLSFVKPGRYTEDWRSAVKRAEQVVGSKTPLLVYTGISHAEYETVQEYQRKEGLILAPVTYYSQNLKSISLPQTFDTDISERYLKEIVQPLIASSDYLSVLVLNTSVIAKNQGHSFMSVDFIGRYFHERGFNPPKNYHFGRISLLLFRK